MLCLALFLTRILCRLPILGPCFRYLLLPTLSLRVRVYEYWPDGPPRQQEVRAIRPTEYERAQISNAIDHAMNILNKNEPIAEDSTKNKLLMAGSNNEDVECWDDDEDLQLDHVPVAAKAVVADDFEHDLEFPEDDAPLKLSTRDEPPRLSTNVVDEFEDWTEASLGTRHGGTGRGARSPRSSSFSAMSPSLSSSFTVESEDEGLGGLVLPEGPLNLGGLLKKRQEKTTVEKLDLTSEDQPVGEAPDQTAISADDDFFAGIDVGDGDVFDSAKPTLNRNIRHKAPGSTSSPPRGTTVNLAFLNKIQAATSRIPRLVSATDRIGSILEPVSETGAPAPSNRRPPSRLGGPSTQPMSASNIPLPSTPSRSAAAPPPTKPREMRSRPSTASLRPEPTTTSTQLLRVKRSMPAMRAAPAGPSKAPAIPPRPPTRQDHGGSRGAIPPRPKTPVDRSGAESSLGMMSRRFPFLPAGLAGAQSHHIATKGPRSVRRHESESSATAIEPPTRSVSRAGAPSRFTHRSCSPHRREGVLETPSRDAAGKRTLVQPAKRRFFGDGSELEIFDDLPTSTAAESKFIKAPVARGAPRSTRGRLGLSPLTETTNDSVPAPSTTIAAGPTAQLSEPVETPVPATPRHENTPRFARDTHASRAAREQRSGPVSGLPMPGFGGNWKAQMAVRGAVGMNMASTAPPLARVKRRRAAAQQKPHLIKPLGDNHNLAKCKQIPGSLTVYHIFRPRRMANHCIQRSRECNTTPIPIDGRATRML